MIYCSFRIDAEDAAWFSDFLRDLDEGTVDRPKERLMPEAAALLERLGVEYLVSEVRVAGKGRVILSDRATDLPDMKLLTARLDDVTLCAMVLQPLVGRIAKAGRAPQRVVIRWAHFDGDGDLQLGLHVVTADQIRTISYDDHCEFSRGAFAPWAESVVPTAP